MDINEIGFTAFIISYFRMLEAEQPRPLFDDPYAEWFVPDEVREKAAQFDAIIPEAGQLLRCRFGFFNDILQREIDNGKTQVVIVGAGFDMRPQIFAKPGVTFFEVDQPAVLQYKHAALKQRGITPCAHVACNYLAVDLPVELAQVGFDAAAPSLFIWEGNTMYLPLEKVYGFLNQLSAAVAEFHIGFDFLTTAVIERSSGVPRITAAADYFADQLGAPWITGFDDTRPFLQNTDLTVFESGGIESLGKRYDLTGAEELAQFKDVYAYCVLEKQPGG